MKKIIILLLLVGFTKSYAQEPVVPVAKKVVNKFIKFGMKAGVNLILQVILMKLYHQI